MACGEMPLARIALSRERFFAACSRAEKLLRLARLCEAGDMSSGGGDADTDDDEDDASRHDDVDG